MATAAEIVVPGPEALRRRLVGERVVLEPLSADHEPGLRAAASDPEMFRWMGVELADSADVLHEWVLAALGASERGLEVPYVITAADDDPRGWEAGAVLGTTRFMSLDLPQLVAEIGWSWVTRPAWGTGVNVETKLLLLEHAFTVAGLRRVEFKTDARNERSRGALTALGAVYEGTFRKHRVLPDGGVRDSAYFSVIDDEWPATRAALRARLAGDRTPVMHR